MNKLLDTLRIHFGEENIYQIENHEGVYLCEKKTASNKTYQVVFIDTTENWCNDNYSSYLEKVVIDKYYQTEGFLQWNFYYYIITTAIKIKKHNQRKKDIENDETYTRKAVLSIDEFSEWVKSFNSISDISTSTISNDLYSDWVNYLRERKLLFVFNSEKYPNYKQPVEDYIKGASFDDVEEIEAFEATDITEPVLKKIDKLELKEFREYPLIREYDLGSVNLIHGANAVGKTSFFDAIELIITGKLFYNKNAIDYKIQLTNDSNATLKYPAQPSPYKKRDIYWYSSGSNRGNELNEHFNKFNYYTSDAAFQLKQDDTNKQNNLQDIIADIALGREVNKLEERIKAFSERFDGWAEFYLSQLTILNDNLREKNETIKIISTQQNNPEGYKPALVESLKSCHWKNTLADNDESIARLDYEIQSVKYILSKIQSENIEIKTLSWDNVEKELKELNLKKFSIESLRNEIINSQQKRQVYLKEVEKNKNIIPVIDELSLYYKHDKNNSLIGLEKKIREETIKLNHARAIKHLADEVLSNDFLGIDSEKSKQVMQLEDEFKTKEELLNKKCLEIKYKIMQIETGIEELSIILINIKSIGKNYIKLNPTAEDCPLCKTHFINGELINAIEKTHNSFSDSVALMSLKEELNNTSKIIGEIRNKIEVIGRLKQLAILLFSSEGYEKTYIEIRDKSIDNHNAFVALTDSLLELNTLQSQFNDLGLTEGKYEYLISRIGDLFLSENQSAIELDLKKQNILDDQSKLISEIQNLENEVLNKETSLNSYFDAEIPNQEYLLKRININQEIESSFKQLEVYLDFPSDTLLINILERVSALASIFETYKTAVLASKQFSQVVKITEKEIIEIIAEIEQLKPKQIRAEYATKELNKLLLKHSKNTFLSDYINKNKTEIVSVFNFIHTPREFKDIRFTDGKITLISNEDGDRTLSEISTGQRSALALSIFLSLNKKLTKGPNVLMFDDPVAYVDDMNVLSFFDYLRELVIKSRRQVFFATANDDLAFLFRKKFEFLESELKEFKLERKAEKV
jgi:hypothetical protein